MLAKQEPDKYSGAERVWVGKYKNSHNLPHWHYACELLYVERGAINVFCDGQTYFLCAGQALWIDGGAVHSMHAETDTVLQMIAFDPDVIKKITEKTRLVSPFLKNNYSIPATFQRLAAELTARKPFYTAAAENEIAALALRIFRGEEVTARQTSDDTAQIFQNLLTDIDENFAYYSFADAARYMNFSEAYFSRFFKKAVGMTFSQYLNRVKTEAAVRLLQDEKNTAVTEIAMRCGFNTIRNFNRIFRDITGYTPKTLPPQFSPGETFVYCVNAPFNPTSKETQLLDEK